MLNLFHVAFDNIGALEAEYSSLLKSERDDHAAAIQQFARRVTLEGRVSINIRPMVLISFLTFGYHENMYEWARSRSLESGRPVEDIVRERLGTFYARRVSFDRAFDSGEGFHYGALNMGGAGTTTYGSYCLVLSESLFRDSGADIAYLRADSLRDYMLTDIEVDASAVRNDATPHSHRHILAVRKLGREILAVVEDSWAGIVCSSHDWIEAIFLRKIQVADVSAVRLRNSEYRDFYRYAFEVFSDKLTDERRFLVDAFVIVKRRLREKGIPFEVVPDA